MKESAPKHVEKFCIKDMEDKVYCQLSDEYQDDYTFVYKIKCTCGCNSFTVYKDEHPSITAKCQDCRRTICIYDLKYYPCAVKLNHDYETYPISINQHEIFSVYVIYEYSDEFEIEDDVAYDPNDIVWARAFVRYDDILEEILDDETA